MLAMARTREPSGRRSRAGHDPDSFPPTLVRRLRDAALAGKSDAKWGSELGRLFLDKKIDEAMFAAGERWATTVNRYHEAIGARPSPKSAALERGSLAEPPDPDSEEGGRIVAHERGAILAMERAHEKLKATGRLAENIVRAVCEHQEPCLSALEFDALHTGLRALAQHWQLTKFARRANGRSSP